MHRFYVPGLPATGDVLLSEDESHHLARVLRLKPGESILLFDGQGREVMARVEHARVKRVTARIVEERRALAEPAVRLTLAQAVLKGDKTEDVIRDAVMLGVTAVQPFLSRRTEVSRKAAAARHDRWMRTAVSSAKQCGRAVVPLVHDIVTFEDMLSATGGLPDRLMFVEPGASQPRAVKGLRSLERKTPVRALVIVGPEGGWDVAEIESAAAAGVTLVSFGHRTLRADAAGAAAIAILQYAWNDL